MTKQRPEEGRRNVPDKKTQRVRFYAKKGLTDGSTAAIMPSIQTCDGDEYALRVPCREPQAVGLRQGMRRGMDFGGRRERESQ